MKLSSSMDCCECGVAVGADGAQRAALLLPCQHVLHMSCVEFTKRRARLWKRLDSTDLGMGLLSNTAGDGAGCFVCPGCSECVESIIPLFAPCDDPKTESNGTGETATAAEFTQTYNAQKQALGALKHLNAQKERVTELNHKCAALHAQRATLLREVEQHHKLFPSLKPVSEFEADTSAHNSAASSSTLPVERMSATELELYLAQTTPTLTQTQTELRRERRKVEQARRKLAALKERYHENKTAAANGTSSRHSRTKVVDADRTASRAEELAAARQAVRARRIMRAVADGARTAAPELFITLNGGDTVSDPGTEAHVVDVDEVASTNAPHVEVVDLLSDSGSEAGGVEEVEVEPNDAEAQLHAALMMLPCSARPDAIRVSAAHIRLLPRREDHLWQSSLQF